MNIINHNIYNIYLLIKLETAILYTMTTTYININIILIAVIQKIIHK